MPAVCCVQKRAGAKGFGLFALEAIPAGQFIIEYIGEVLDEEEYLRRKDFYAEVRDEPSRSKEREFHQGTWQQPLQGSFFFC